MLHFQEEVDVFVVVEQIARDLAKWGGAPWLRPNPHTALSSSECYDATRQPANGF